MTRQIALSALVAIAATVSVTLPAPIAAKSADRQLNSDTFIDIARDVLPAVVNINIKPKDGAPQPEGMDKDIYQYLLQHQDEMDGPYYNQVSGSGVMFDRRGDLGYVITNEHVVEPFDETKTVMELTFHQRNDDSNDYSKTTVITGDALRIIGHDELSDLAVIEFVVPDALKNVTPVSFGDSDALEMGELVLALGNPLNFNHTITQGMVSGKSRNLGSQVSLEKLIQTDAVIQPGNSGGPLVNLDGKIVGINNAIVSRTGLWQGTSFAIPGNDAKRISYDLIDKGRVQRGYLGVTMQDVGRYAQIQKRYQLDAPMGVLVTYVVPDSPADVAGIHSLDVITQINGEPVTSPDHLLRSITSLPVNDKIDLSVVRLGDDKSPQVIKVVAKLTERPNEKVIRGLHDGGPDSAIIPMIPEDGGGPGKLLGIEAEEYVKLDGADRITGLRVTDIKDDSPAAKAGLLSGDVITDVNGRSVRTIDDLQAALAGSEGKQYELLVRRDNGELDTIKLDNPNYTQD